MVQSNSAGMGEAATVRQSRDDVTVGRGDRGAPLVHGVDRRSEVHDDLGGDMSQRVPDPLRPRRHPTRDLDHSPSRLTPPAGYVRALPAGVTVRFP